MADSKQELKRERTLHKGTVLDGETEQRVEERRRASAVLVMKSERYSPSPDDDKLPTLRTRHHRITIGRVVGSLILAALVAGFAALALGVWSGNWQIQPILSGSMRPGFPIGGVVVAQRVPTSSLQLREVILFHPPGEATDTYVHRIISLEKAGSALVVRTKGDDNPVPDPWTLRLKGRWAYEARFTVPLIGYAAVWAHSTTGRQALMLTGGVLILLCGALVMGSAALARRREGSSQEGTKGTGRRPELDHG